MSERIEDFSYLWDGESNRYALLRTQSDSTDIDDLLVFDKVSKTVLLVEDQEVAREICRRLREKGIPIITTEEIRRGYA